jgi:hypothetical protein
MGQPTPRKVPLRKRSRRRLPCARGWPSAPHPRSGFLQLLAPGASPDNSEGSVSEPQSGEDTPGVVG